MSSLHSIYAYHDRGRFFGIGEKFLHEVLEMVRFTHEICMVGSKAVYKVGSFSARFIAVDGAEIF